MNVRCVRVARVLFHGGTVAAIALCLANCGGGDGPTSPPATVATVQIGGAPAENALLVGGTVQLSATARDAGGVTLARTVVWASTNSAVITVSPAGLVTAVNAGAATITATTDAVSAAVSLSVRAPIPVPPAGTPTAITTTVLGGAVTLTVPPAATSTTTLLTAAPALTPPSDNRVVPGAAYTFGPAGTVFTTPITMSLRLDPNAVPAAKRADVRINVVNPNGTLSEIPGGSVDLGANRVSAPISHFSTYVLVAPSDPTQLAVSAGNNQSARFGTAVVAQPRVVVRDAQDRPVRLADVKFAVASGGGGLSFDGAPPVSERVVETDTLGIATLDAGWVLGGLPGPNTLEASILGTQIGVLFAATATAPATQVAIRAQPTAATSGLVLPSSIAVEIRNQFGGVVANETSLVSATLVGGNGQLTGSVGRAAVDGVATFNDLRIGGNGPQRLRFMVVGLTPDTTDAIEVTQVVAGLALTAAPNAGASNEPFETQPVVELRDHAGLRVVGGTQPVTASIVNGSGILFGNPTVRAVDGVVTYSGLGIEGGGPHVVAFSSGGATQVNTPSLAITPPPPGIRLRVGDSPTTFMTGGGTLLLPLRVDLSQAQGQDVASLSVTISWDPARMSFVSEAAGAWTDVQQSAASVTVNTADVANGTLRIAGFTPSATTASFVLRNISLQAAATASAAPTPIMATITAAGNAAGAAIAITPRAHTVTVSPTAP